MSTYVAENAKKFLCICDGGNVRSRALAFRLKWDHHQEAIAIGRFNTSPATMDMLCNWADYIVLMQPHMSESVPEKYHSKIVVIDVGPDVWGIELHPQLNQMTQEGANWLVGKAYSEVKE